MFPPTSPNIEPPAFDPQPASSNVEPPTLDPHAAASPNIEPPAFNPRPAEGLEDIEILPFTVAKFRKAITERLRAFYDSVDVPQWMVFSDFDSSKLKYIDQRRYPIRIQVDSNTLVIKIVYPIHEQMHADLLDYIKQDMLRIGLRLCIDYTNLGAGRCDYRSGNSSKEGDSSIRPKRQPPTQWPSFVIEAGWSESVPRLHRDAEWWLSAQLPPDCTTLVVLISFNRPQRTFHLEKYELISIPNPYQTRSSPFPFRNISTSTGSATVNLQTIPPTVTGAPFILPFTGIMQRPPTATQRDISLSAAVLQSWAISIAEDWNL